MTEQTKTEERKKEHLEICLNTKVETGTTWLEHMELIHNSFPEINLNNVRTSTSFLGKKLDSPLMIAAMTGGIPDAQKINRDLANIAEKKGIAFGLGSQRAMLENPENKHTFDIRHKAPKTLLLGNLGITQLKQYDTAQIKKMIEDLKLDGLCVHVNPAQEAFQKEGDTDFINAYNTLENFIKKFNYPVIIKEVGNGINKDVAYKLRKIGVKAIDVGGKGGTSWIKVERNRSKFDKDYFDEWGIPTAASILEVKKDRLPTIATGGIRTGIDVAKAIALGADICGMALPVLKIYERRGSEGVERFIDQIEEDLKKVMFLTGSKSIADLQNAPYILHGPLQEWKQQRQL